MYVTYQEVGRLKNIRLQVSVMDKKVSRDRKPVRCLDVANVCKPPKWG